LKKWTKLLIVIAIQGENHSNRSGRKIFKPLVMQIGLSYNVLCISIFTLNISLGGRQNGKN